MKRQIDPDPLDVRKAAIEDQMIAESEEREELQEAVCIALGWKSIGKTKCLPELNNHWVPPGKKGGEFVVGLPPLDANLLTTAKAKLLTTDELRGRYADALCSYAPAVAVISDWALTQSTEVQQARAILEAIATK